MIGVYGHASGGAPSKAGSRGIRAANGYFEQAIAGKPAFKISSNAIILNLFETFDIAMNHP